MNQTITSAIATKHLIAFEYHGCHRIAEPHVYGISRSEDAVLAFQVAGTSQSGGLPNWRRVKLSEMHNLHVMPQTFPGPRPTPSGQHSSWDYIYAIVK